VKLRLILCLATCSALVLQAQEKDFLTANEVEQIREAQDPNDRLLLYVHFAKQRMDLIEQYLAKDKPGRSIFIHNTLEEYTKIIEAIDSVSDDALRHNRPLEKGTIAVINAEKEFADKLAKVQESNPRDLDRYKFVLDEALDTTRDSRELSVEDTNRRTAQLAAEDSKEKKEREALMPKKEVSERKKDAAAQSQEEQKKKVPSLLRPGEKPQQPRL
jgi:hypothetical protein